MGRIKEILINMMNEEREREAEMLDADYQYEMWLKEQGYLSAESDQERIREHEHTTPTQERKAGKQ